MNTKKNKVLNLALIGIYIVSIVFILILVGKYESQIGLLKIDDKDVKMALLLSIIYGISNSLLARAWWNILMLLRTNTSWQIAFRIFGTSQIAKYTPGNFLHFAGRQTLGLAAGMPGWKIAKSSVLEIALILFSGTIFSLFTIGLPWIPVNVPYTYSLVPLAFLISILVIYRPINSYATRTIGWQILFLTTSSAIFLVVLNIVSKKPIAIYSLPFLGGAYVAAWLVGVVTPGAPAGLGIREAVLLFLLDGHVESETVIDAALLMRMITILGDSLFFVTALSFEKFRKYF